VGVALDSSGNLYVADVVGVIWKVTGNVATIVAGGGTSTADGVSATAEKISPYGIDVDSAGNLYIADGGAKIRKVATGTNLITTLASGFSVAYDLKLDPSGNVVVGDRNGAIWRVAPNGTKTQLTGATGGDTGDGGLATNASIHEAGLTVDGASNIYFVQQGQSDPSRVRRIDGVSSMITTIAGPGLAINQAYVSYGDGGVATQAAFQGLYSIAADASGNVFVGEGFRIRVINQLLSISGVVIATGKQQGPLSSWPITLTLNGAPYGTAITDSNGNYAVNNVGQGGTYVIQPWSYYPFNYVVNPPGGSDTFTSFTASLTNIDFEVVFPNCVPIKFGSGSAGDCSGQPNCSNGKTDDYDLRIGIWWSPALYRQFPLYRNDGRHGELERGIQRHNSSEPSHTDDLLLDGHADCDPGFSGRIRPKRIASLSGRSDSSPDLGSRYGCRVATVFDHGRVWGELSTSNVERLGPDFHRARRNGISFAHHRRQLFLERFRRSELGHPHQPFLGHRQRHGYVLGSGEYEQRAFGVDGHRRHDVFAR